MTLKGRRSVLKGFDRKARTRAIYVDYEGNKFAPPTLLGWQIEGRYAAAIVEPRFETCARRWRARDVLAADHRATVISLVDWAVAERRHIVSWSTHDLKLMHAVLGEESYREQLLGCYVNALDLARPWHRRCLGTTAPGGARLAYFANLLRFRIPPAYGERIVASNLSAVRARLLAGLDYGDFVQDDRSRWITIVKDGLNNSS